MKTILYIEDDAGLRVAIPALLKTCERCFHGAVEIVTENDFAAGLARIEHGGIDVVMLDLTLPPFGSEATLSMYAEHSEQMPPTLIITGANHVELRQRAIALGAADYVCKDGINLCPEALLERVYNAFLRHLYDNAKRPTRT